MGPCRGVLLRAVTFECHGMSTYTASIIFYSVFSKDKAQMQARSVRRLPDGQSLVAKGMAS